MAERYISMLSMPIVTLILLFPKEIALVVLGGTFETSAGPLRFLAVSMLLNLLNGVYASQINAVNRPDISAKLTLMSLIVNLSLLALFIPTSIFGVTMLGLSSTGAAIANMIGVTVLFVTTRFIATRLTGTTSNPRILMHVLAAVLTGVGLLILANFWTITRWFDLIGFGIVSVMIFSLILFALRELTLNDVRFFMSVVNPREMKDYISSEFKKKE